MITTARLDICAGVGRAVAECGLLSTWGATLGKVQSEMFALNHFGLFVKHMEAENWFPALVNWTEQLLSYVNSITKTEAFT